MDARTDRDENAVTARWDQIRREERLDQARHVAQDAERDARVAAYLVSSAGEAGTPETS